jgi:hypothetical protein
MADSYSRPLPPSSASRGSRSQGQDIFDNQEAKLRYQVYRCEYARYEAYRYDGLHSRQHLWVHGPPLCLPSCNSRLQSTSVAIGESFPIPEIVAIGGQSDGKSSLLEAFLGVSSR